VPAWQKKLQTHGYTVVGQFPETGFAKTELGLLRLIYFVGPGGLGFELFEFEEEYPF
jgi:hypothetical protein